MRRQAWVGAALLALLAAGWACGGEPPCSEPHPVCSPWRLGPAGAWFPDGGGLLHWWAPHCFPRCGAPDNYCRKNLPCVCWPPHPPYYIEGPSEICHSQGSPSAHSGCVSR
jgi:hypothetical protein